MSLGVLTTGCRPGVLLNLTIGPYYSGKPAFNIFMVDGEDSEIHEECGSSKILRRLNPFLPPRSKACPHQLALNSSKCPESCDRECKPDGRNIRYGFVNLSLPIQLPKDSPPPFLKQNCIRINFYCLTRVDWDKNSSSQGESSLYLLNEVATYFDLYVLVRNKKLAEMGLDWLMA